jgi:hypothetical protein
MKKEVLPMFPSPSTPKFPCVHCGREASAHGEDGKGTRCPALSAKERARLKRLTRRGRLFFCLWSAATAKDEAQQYSLQCAIDYGIPIRVMVMPDGRIPEEALRNVPDLQIVRCGSVAEATAHVRRWLLEGLAL